MDKKPGRVAAVVNVTVSNSDNDLIGTRDGAVGNSKNSGNKSVGKINIQDWILQRLNDSCHSLQIE